MTTSALNEAASDSDLWALVNQGNASAFELLVRRHQSLVSAAAYSACGDLALSEDVAQETFWAAWRGRASLAEPGRLRAWLCGIARNLGHNARRRASRPAESAGPLEAVPGLAAHGPGPADEAVSREEEALVWQTLEQVPETYREPLVLFYRQQQSVAEVAGALGLGEDAVKQRLARGRAMLRERMAEVVEGALRRSRPGRAFTASVMAGLTAASAGAQTALAGTGAAALKAAAGAGGGALGGLLGPLAGLLGGWLGTWLPAQAAPGKREREHLLRTGRRMLLVSVLFLVALAALVLAFPARRSLAGYLISLAAWFVAYWAYVGIESVRALRTVQRIRAEGDEPSDAPLRVRLNAAAGRYRGRVFRSRAMLFGLPLLDVNVSDPGRPPGECRVARGWVAVGDEARGVLLAVGSRARGLVALGGRSVGVLSVGGVAVGVVAVGGLALGVLAVGGLGLGVYALGGLAAGWQACGGLAVAWDVACGGGAVARHAAYGGGAFAHEYAVGGAARAHHANDEAARAVLLNHPLTRGMGWYIANNAWLTPLGVGLGLFIPCAMLPLMYRRSERVVGAPVVGE